MVKNRARNTKQTFQITKKPLYCKYATNKG